MPSLQAFPSVNVRRIDYGDSDKWEMTVDFHGTVTMTLKPGETDTVTVTLRDGYGPPIVTPCEEGSTVTIAVAAVVVRAK